MAQLPEKQDRPSLATEAIQGDSSANGSLDSHSLTALDEIARHVDGTFVVVVETTGGKYRRCFLTVKAAEDTARRATERGENATVYLAELQPLWKLQGGGPL
jgi:hypothetical protein